jgi:hypothetical protein
MSLPRNQPDISQAQQAKLDRWASLIDRYTTPNYERLPSKPPRRRLDTGGHEHGTRCGCVGCVAAGAVLAGFITNLVTSDMPPEPVPMSGPVGSLVRWRQTFDLALVGGGVQRCYVLPGELALPLALPRFIRGTGTIQEGELVLVAGAKDGTELFVNEVVASGSMWMLTHADD